MHNIFYNCTYIFAFFEWKQQRNKTISAKKNDCHNEVLSHKLKKRKNNVLFLIFMRTIGNQELHDIIYTKKNASYFYIQNV